MGIECKKIKICLYDITDITDLFNISNFKFSYGTDSKNQQYNAFISSLNKEIKQSDWTLVYKEGFFEVLRKCSTRQGTLNV